MRSLYPVLVVLILLARDAASAQTESASPMRAIRTVPLARPLPSLLEGGIGCDARGTFYLHPYRANQVLRVTSEGKYLGPLVLPPNVAPQTTIEDFATSGEGLTYLLTNDRATGISSVWVYDGGGQVLRTIRLHRPPASTWFQPLKMSIFSSGRMLILGTSSNQPVSGLTPFSGVFDSSGRFLAHPTYEGEKPDNARKPLTFGGMTYLDASRMSLNLLTSDGRLGYLVLDVDKAPRLAVLEDSGNIIRSFLLETPGKGFRPSAFIQRDGHGAIEFVRDSADPGKPQNKEIVLYDLAAGTTIGRWDEAVLGEVGYFTCLDKGDVIEIAGEALVKYPATKSVGK